MARLTMTQARGLAELAGQAFEGALDAAERTQREFTRASYRVLGHVPLVAGPARAVERVQRRLTAGVYGGIRLGARSVCGAVGGVLDLLHLKGRTG